jgi:hypothetical protein
MAFQNKTFPSIKLIHGVQRTELAPVNTTGNFLNERRIKKHRSTKFQWTIPAYLMEESYVQELRDFLAGVDFALDSFRFKDPFYPEFVDAPLSHHSTDLWKLNIPRQFDGTAGTHPIFNPVVGELTATVDGSPQAINAFSIVNGEPVIQLLGTTGTETVLVSGNCYMTVRLDSTLSQQIVALDTANKPLGLNMNDIKLTEVFEY